MTSHDPFRSSTDSTSVMSGEVFDLLLLATFSGGAMMAVRE
jgi:hypothetical protein